MVMMSSFVEILLCSSNMWNFMRSLSELLKVFLYLFLADIKWMDQRETSLPSRNNSSSAFCLMMETKTFVQLFLSLFYTVSS